MPSPLVSSNSSQPGVPSAGSPWSASAMRARGSDSRGTLTVAPESLSLTRKPSCSSVSITLLAVEGVNPL